MAKPKRDITDLEDRFRDDPEWPPGYHVEKGVCQFCQQDLEWRQKEGSPGAMRASCLCGEGVHWVFLNGDGVWTRQNPSYMTHHDSEEEAYEGVNAWPKDQYRYRTGQFQSCCLLAMRRGLSSVCPVCRSRLRQAARPPKRDITDLEERFRFDPNPIQMGTCRRCGRLLLWRQAGPDSPTLQFDVWHADCDCQYPKDSHTQGRYKHRVWLDDRGGWRRMSADCVDTWYGSRDDAMKGLSNYSDIRVPEGSPPGRPERSVRLLPEGYELITQSGEQHKESVKRLPKRDITDLEDRYQEEGRLFFDLQDVCLPDYWRGSPYSRFQIPVHYGMTNQDVVDAIVQEWHMAGEAWDLPEDEDISTTEIREAALDVVQRGATGQYLSSGIDAPPDREEDPEGYERWERDQEFNDSVYAFFNVGRGDQYLRYRYREEAT